MKLMKFHPTIINLVYLSSQKKSFDVLSFEVLEELKKEPKNLVVITALWFFLLIQENLIYDKYSGELIEYNGIKDSDFNCS